MTSKEIGNIGEDYTADFLRSKGCKILARNFAIVGGEIDIIAEKEQLIHFVEVKSRKRNSLQTASNAVTPTKIKRIVKTASEFIVKNHIEYSCVFDVACVEIDNGKVTGFEYFQRAFTA